MNGEKTTFRKEKEIRMSSAASLKEKEEHYLPETKPSDVWQSPRKRKGKIN